MNCIVGSVGISRTVESNVLLSKMDYVQDVLDHLDTEHRKGVLTSMDDVRKL